MLQWNRVAAQSMLAALMTGFCAICFSNPTLTVGVWTRISPTTLGGATNLMAVDPGNPNILYLTASHGDKLGLLKSTDGGSTWARIGNPPASPNYGDTVDYLDSPFKVRVDPANSQHMYATQMSPGGTVTQGFWVTYNGGAKWVRTKGFMDAVKLANATTDVGHFDVDPTDFNHVLVACHYYWNDGGAGVSGIFETKDGGNTFIVHYPVTGMSGPSKAVWFLYDPPSGRTDLSTWLISEDGSGLWRTSDAGATWTKVSSLYTPHGGTTGHVYTRAGVLYTGGGQFLLRSRDNGITWETVPNSGFHAYTAVATDGEKIYDGGMGTVSAPYSAWYTSPDTDGEHWTGFAGPTAADGPVDLQYDSVNHIMYSANGPSGLWALKVSNQTTVTAQKKSATAGSMAPIKAAITKAKTGIVIRTAAGNLFDAKGRNIMAK
jgi:photosystem II stability/assembly factor-like uncharacterized protein